MIDRQPPPGFNPDVLTPPPLKNKTWQISSLALDVSGSCNLACRYCAEAATQPHRRKMSEETLAAAWRFLFPDDQTRAGCSIRLGSGEPLLAFPLLRKLAGLTKKEQGADGEEVSPEVFLTTNGTLANREIREWLVTSGWHVKLSLDGPQFIHDRWRVTSSGQGTFEKIAEVARDLSQRIPEKFSVTAVLCQRSAPQVVFDAVANLGVKRIEMVPVVHQDKTVLPTFEDIAHYKSFIEDYARCYLSQGTKLPKLIRFENCVRRVLGYDVKRVPCGAGRSFMGVGPDGSFYPCFRFIGIEAYCLGDLISGLDSTAVRNFQQNPGRPYEQRTACSQCWAAPLCGGPCFACTEMFGPGDGEPIASQCAYRLADANAAVWLVSRLREQNPERLLAFLPAFEDIYAQFD